MGETGSHLGIGERLAEVCAVLCLRAGQRLLNLLSIAFVPQSCTAFVNLKCTFCTAGFHKFSCTCVCAVLAGELKKHIPAGGED